MCCRADLSELARDLKGLAPNLELDHREVEFIQGAPPLPDLLLINTNNIPGRRRRDRECRHYY